MSRLCARADCITVLSQKRADALWCSDACRVAATRARKAEQSPNTQPVPIQRVRLLALLRERGDLGIHTFELRGMHIANPSQRAADLEARGHTVRRQRERFGKAFGSRYWLTRDAEASR